MATFSIAPKERFSSVKTSIKKPTEIAYFSYDAEHVLHPFSELSLRYYYPPFFKTPGDSRPEPIDLSKGFDTFRQRNDSPDEHLDGLLDTLVEAERRTGKRTDADVITWRGMMTKILTAPYEDQDGFEMNATRFEGTIFVEENHAQKLQNKEDQRNRWSNQRGPPQGLAEYWGYKFETLCLMSAPWGDTSREEIENRENEVVDNYPQYCNITKTGIGSTSLVIGGEVDGVMGYKPENPDDPATWIELKTARPPTGERDTLIYEKKLLKFWAQSFLLGVPRIIIGLRDRDGFLVNIEEMMTQRIPGIVQKTGRRSWNGNTCISFAGALLEFLRHTIVGDGVWRIRKIARSDIIQVYQVDETGTGAILSKKFLEWRAELAQEMTQTTDPTGGDGTDGINDSG